MGNQKMLVNVSPKHLKQLLNAETMWQRLCILMKPNNFFLQSLAVQPVVFRFLKSNHVFFRSTRLMGRVLNVRVLEQPNYFLKNFVENVLAPVFVKNPFTFGCHLEPSQTKTKKEFRLWTSPACPLLKRLNTLKKRRSPIVNEKSPDRSSAKSKVVCNSC